MKSTFSAAILLPFILILSSCSTPKSKDTLENTSTEGKTSFAINHKALADLMLERMDLQTGERVIFVGTPGRFNPLITELSEQIGGSSAEYLGTISVTSDQPQEWTTEFISETIGMDDATLKEYLKQADLGIMLPDATPDDRVYGLIQDNLNEGFGRTIHFHWTGAYDFNGQLLGVNDEIDQFYQKAILATDYAELAKNQLRFEEAMRNKLINVTTPAGTNISFEIGGRPVTNQNGDASARTASVGQNLIDREMELPAGAVRMAPIETSVNGKIAFPDATWNDVMVTGLILTFEKGVVVNMEAKSGIEGVQQVMDEAGIVAKSFREFALGMNPKLTIQDSWIPYYGYGAGVVRLSLGDNIELGGNVSGGFVRWNFFTDATVTVGDEVWVEGGKLVK